MLSLEVVVFDWQRNLPVRGINLLGNDLEAQRSVPIGISRLFRLAWGSQVIKQ
jgi:hypothetical protein